MHDEEKKKFRELIEDVKQELNKRHDITRIEVKTTSDKPRLLIGNLKPPEEKGTNNLHEEGSRWVIVELDEWKNNLRIRLVYSEDGVAGVPDASSLVALEKAELEDIVEFVEKYYL